MGGGLVNGSRANNVEKYDPATNTWTVLAPLLAGKSETSAGLLGKTIVAADGYTSSAETGDNEGYNVSTNTWSPLKPDPSPRNASCFGVVSGDLYVAGGYDSNVSPNAISVTESFILTNWTTLLSMPKATSFPASIVGNGLLHCFGGENSFSGSVLNNVQIYQP
jgi:N-acetylneuraminic acid mutarotase